jgi:hypothetical protein
MSKKPLDAVMDAIGNIADGSSLGVSAEEGTTLMRLRNIIDKALRKHRLQWLESGTGFGGSHLFMRLPPPDGRQIHITLSFDGEDE